MSVQSVQAESDPKTNWNTWHTIIGKSLSLRAAHVQAKGLVHRWIDKIAGCPSTTIATYGYIVY
jgi:hypothetical protein